MPLSLRTHTTYRTIPMVHLFSLFKVLFNYSMGIKWFITWRQIKLQAEPNHNASVLDLLSSSPEHNLNKSSFLNRLLADEVSSTRQVVSSAYCDNLNSLELSDRPFIDVSLLIALAWNSTPITKRIPEMGHFCLTPRTRGKKRCCKAIVSDTTLW